MGADQGQDQRASGSQATDTSGSANQDPSKGSGGESQSGETSANGSGNEGFEELKKSVDGLQSLMGKWGNEINDVREFRKEFETIKQKLDSFNDTKEKSGNNGDSTQTREPVLTIEDEKRINERWKAFPPEKREQMISEAEGRSRPEKLAVVRKTLARIYAEEAMPTPEELFPTNPEASQSGNRTRAVNTISTLGRELLGITETGNVRRVPPGGQVGSTRHSGSQTGDSSDSRRGRTSGGLGGLLPKK